MEEFNFYVYDSKIDKMKIYSEDIQEYFDLNFNVKVESLDFDQNQNVVLYIEQLISKTDKTELEKSIMKKIPHLNDVEVRNMKIVLMFSCKEIELI